MKVSVQTERSKRDVSTLSCVSILQPEALGVKGEWMGEGSSQRSVRHRGLCLRSQLLGSRGGGKGSLRPAGTP